VSCCLYRAAAGDLVSATANTHELITGYQLFSTVVNLALRWRCRYLLQRLLICAELLVHAVEWRSYSELLNCIRRRKDELNVSFEILDAVSGLQSGYSAKLFIAPAAEAH
jgi:hypothetical protein